MSIKRIQTSDAILDSIADINNNYTEIETMISAKADSSSVPTKTSDLTNDSGFIDDTYHDNTKVDKETGKGLSTNDYDTTEKQKVADNTTARHTHSNKSILDNITASYTTEEKTKLAGLVNYDDTALSGRVTTIEGKIPAQATSTNPLADKDFVNSTVGTNTAIFRGTYNTLAELQAQTATNNDYGFVISTDSAGNTIYNRYKYNGSSWVFEYALNNSSFTAQQWSAIQSGITQALVALISTNQSNIATILADYIKSTDLSAVATSGSYNDLNNKPNIPDSTSDLTNDSNFISSTVVTTFWSGTQAEYDAITTKDAHTLYLINES